VSGEDGLKERIAALEGELARKSAAVTSLEAVIRAREAEIRELYQSLSWKVTGPLRVVKHLFVPQPGGKRLKLSEVLAWPRRSLRDLHTKVVAVTNPHGPASLDPPGLTQSAREIYHQLRRARERMT
jgi:hypothetical protein